MIRAAFEGQEVVEVLGQIKLSWRKDFSDVPSMEQNFPAPDVTLIIFSFSHQAPFLSEGNHLCWYHSPPTGSFYPLLKKFAPARMQNREMVPSVSALRLCLTPLAPEGQTSVIWTRFILTTGQFECSPKCQGKGLDRKTMQLTFENCN